MFASFWLWRQLLVNVIGGVLHFHGHNSYSAIVRGCKIVWNSVCGILDTRRADNKSLTTVEWRCLKTIFHWRLSTQLWSRLREVVWMSVVCKQLFDHLGESRLWIHERQRVVSRTYEYSVLWTDWSAATRCLWLSLREITQGFIVFIGGRVGLMVRALAFPQCGPGSISALAVIRRLSLLVLYSAMFSSGYSGFPLSPKTNNWLDLIWSDL